MEWKRCSNGGSSGAFVWFEEIAVRTTYNVQYNTSLSTYSISATFVIETSSSSRLTWRPHSPTQSHADEARKSLADCWSQTAVLGIPLCVIAYHWNPSMLYCALLKFSMRSFSQTHFNLSGFSICPKQYFLKIFYLFKGVIRPICAKTTIKSKDHQEIREGRGTQIKNSQR